MKKPEKQSTKSHFYMKKRNLNSSSVPLKNYKEYQTQPE